MLAKLFLFLCFCINTQSTDIQTLLSGYEWKLKPKIFLERNEDTAQQLMEISNNQNVHYHIRVRAMIALGLFQEERVIQFLEQKIKNEPKSASLIRQLSSLSKVSSGQKERFVRSAKHLISNKNDHVRLSVAKTLKAINTRSARSLLKTLASQETNPNIKKYIENGRIY